MYAEITLIGELPMRLSNMFDYSLMKTKERAQLALLAEVGWKPSMKIVDPSCWIGIEVEVENVPNAHHEQFKFWKKIVDGSLRNNGYEYVSPPLRGKLIEAALLELDSHLKGMNPHYEFSDRTSVHIHMNVRHLTPEQLVMFLITYIALEPLFFKYTEKVPNSQREENNYCVPVNASKYHLHIPTYLGKFLAEGDVKYIHYLVNDWRKYTAFNLRPIAETNGPNGPLGTVEFRHMGGNCDIAYIIGWINMIQSLRKYVKTHTMDEIKQVLFDLNSNSAYAHFLKECLGTDLQIPFDELMPLLEDSTTASKEIFSLVQQIKDTKPSDETFLKSPLCALINSISPNTIQAAGASNEEYKKLLKLLQKEQVEFREAATDHNKQYHLNQYLILKAQVDKMEEQMGPANFKAGSNPYKDVDRYEVIPV